MTDNSKLPAPRKGSGKIFDICLGVAADVASVASAGGLPTNAAAELIKAFKQKRIDAAEEVLLAELRAGKIDLKDAEAEELIPIAYRFFRAAEEGEAVRTLRIFARILAGQLQSDALDASNFAFTANALSGLPERELSLLAEYIEQTEPHAEGKETRNIQEYVEIALVPDVYSSKLDLSASASLLAGRGLLLGIDEAMLGGGLTRYFASPFAKAIKALAKDLN
ncbi:hypothetical protein [Microvirga calopogonii]|uniref:hypothetical protein n=1 Tax=Microvirga calopogonii TaxID=2078013 RepID=UPI000E0DCAB7|nr:hypothetical protein [Microvirga calopogonii]